MRSLTVFLITLFMFSTASAENSHLSVGDKIEDFTLPDSSGKPMKLSSFLEYGPVVLTFYRGGWCPVCNKQLNEMQQRIFGILDTGAFLIAVSPETPTNAQKTIMKNKIMFDVLSDKGNKLAKKLGLLWEIPKDQQKGYSEWLIGETGKDFKDFNGQEGYILPIPATFVIKQDGTVVFAFVDPDYKKRAKFDDIVSALKSIK